MNVGIIGAGWWAEQHALALSTLEDFSVAAVSSGTLASTQDFVQRFGGVACTSSQDLLAQSAVEAVLVAAPHALHHTLAIEVLRAGKPLLLEKPVATNAPDTQDVLHLARTLGLPCLIGFTSHYFPGFSAAKALLESGELGRTLAGHSVFQKFWMEPNRREWHRSREQGGGMLLTAGIHALDRLMWLMDAPVQSVSAVIGTHLHDQQADDLANLFLRMDQGRSALVGSYGYRQGGPLNSTHILTEEASLRVMPDRLDIGRHDTWETLTLPARQHQVLDALAAEWSDLRAWYLEGQTPQVQPEFAEHVMDVIFAAEQSSKEGTEIQLNQTTT